MMRAKGAEMTVLVSTRRVRIAVLLLALTAGGLAACADDDGEDASPPTSASVRRSTTTAPGGGDVRDGDDGDDGEDDREERPDREERDEADVRVTAASSRVEAAEGTPVEVDLTVTNRGPATARDVVLVVEGADAVALRGDACPSRCRVGTLRSGASVHVTATATARAGERAVRASASSSTSDPSSRNQTVTVTVAGSKTDEPPLRVATRLVASPTVLETDPVGLGAVVAGPEASLVTAAGAPVAGAEVTFRAAGEDLCTAITDSEGHASCTTSTVAVDLLLASLEYDAVYSGDAGHAASTDTAPIIR